jgi:hypothetical protein
VGAPDRRLGPAPSATERSKVMTLSKPLKVAIGGLSLWPVVYMFLFIAFMFTSIFWMSSDGARHSAGPPLAFLVIFGLHLGTILMVFALLAFYMVFLFKTDRVPPDKKALWAVVLFLGHMFSIPVFFYLYVWPDAWPRRTVS